MYTLSPIKELLRQLILVVVGVVVAGVGLVGAGVVVVVVAVGVATVVVQEVTLDTCHIPYIDICILPQLKVVVV